MRRSVLAICLLALAAAGVASAQDAGPEKLTDAVTGTVETEQATQSSLDDWSEEKQALEIRYKTAQANIDYLQERIERRQEVANALDGKVAELERRLTESERLNEVIQDTLNFVLGELEEVVAADLPFLAQEREARLSNLRRQMANPDSTPAERLRLLLEALLIEAQYGETVEVAPETILVGDQSIHADVLRIGRLTVYWRSPDGSRVGTWDPATGSWTELDGKYNRVITRSMEMATRIRPTELVSLPLGRITR